MLSDGDSSGNAHNLLTTGRTCYNDALSLISSASSGRVEIDGTSGSLRMAAAADKSLITAASMRDGPDSAPPAATSDDTVHLVLRPDPRTPGFAGLLQTLGAYGFLIVFGSSLFFIIAWALYLVIGPMYLGHRIAPTLLAALWIVQAMAPLPQFKQDPEAMHNHWLLRELAHYFSATLVMEQRLHESKQYIIAQFPHGSVPVASFVCAQWVRDVAPRGHVFCLAHSGIFHLPIVRFIVSYVGAVAATKENIARIRDEKAAHCCIVVGGVREMFLTDERTEQILMRRGFVREAIRNGFDILPQFHFGNTRVYRFLGPAWIYSTISASLPFPFFLVIGQYGTLVPRRQPIKSVIGASIGVQHMLGLKEGERVTEPTDEQVDLVLARFKQRLLDLYARHRPEWETRSLVIRDA